MARLSSTSSGTDITVEPKLISRPVSEMTDDELLAEIERLRGERGTAVSTPGRGSNRGPAKPSGPVKIDEIG
jgi:hypothetical protein